MVTYFILFQMICKTKEQDCILLFFFFFFYESYKESIADKCHALEREVDNCSLQLLVAP